MDKEEEAGILQIAKESYILVTWPESQKYMEEPWFREECYLCLAMPGQQYYDSAYFIPLKRITENKSINNI